MRLYKVDAINIKISPALKQKFHIAVGDIGMSAVICNFIQDYVRNFEDKRGVIPVALSEDELYDIITKVFGPQIYDSRLKDKTKGKLILNEINKLYGLKISEKDFNSYIEKYPKTRKDIFILNDNQTKLSRDMDI